MIKVIGIILVVAVIGWIYGYFSSGGDSGEATETAMGAGIGCGYIIFQIFLAGLGIIITLWLFGAIFG